VRPTKKSILNPLVQGTKRRREFGEEDENGGGLDDTDYKADESLIGGRGDQYATRSTEYDLETDGSVKVDGKKIRLNEVGETVSALRGVMSTDHGPQDGEIDDGLYRGAANYLPTINKRTDVMDTKMKTGPIRATTNIRTITLVDYQPDVCKDYKETGFCGYGDSCKFLHDRGDYLAGWQLDKLGPEHGGVPADDDDDEEEVPFACLICRKEFTEPIVTKCGHYFCMR
jgi:RING finger protein 113A